MSDDEDLLERVKASLEAGKERFGEEKDKFFDMVKAFLGQMKPEDAMIYAGLAYLGYDRLPANIPDMAKLLWGPIGLKLATSPGGQGASFGVKIFGTGIEFPVNSQVAGLTMLVSLGFACLPWENLHEQIDKEIKGWKQASTAYAEIHNMYWSVLTQDEKNEVEQMYINITMLALGSHDEYLQAIESFLGYVNGMRPTWEERLLESGKAPGQGGAR